MALTSLTKEQFKQYLEKVPEASFLQSLEMAELLSKRGFKVAFMAHEAIGDIKVAAIVYSKPMTGGLHMEVNAGPIATDKTYLSAFYQELMTYAKDNNALQLLVKPYDTYQTFDSNGQPTGPENTVLIQHLTDLGYKHDGLQTGYPGGEPDWHYVKDLSQLTTETLFKSLSKKGKPLVKKAHSFGIKLRPLKRDELHRFKAITSATSERREYSDKDLDYYQDFYDSFGQKAEFMMASINFCDYLTKIELGQEQLNDKINQLKQQYLHNQDSPKFNRVLKELVSQKETFNIRHAEALSLIETYGEADIDLAASLFIYDNKEAVYLFSGSLPEFNKFYAPALLQEHAMAKAIQQHIPTYNMLGITGLFDGSDGVLRFKQQFNGHITRKMGTFRYYPNPFKFKAIQTLKKLANTLRK